MIRACLIPILLLFAPPALASPSAQQAFADVADKFEADARAEKIVGGTLLLLDNGRVVGERRFGMADEAKKQPVDANTIYHWASITKTFTAIALMQLVERNLVSLDDPVVKYIPEFAAVHNPFGKASDITVRHLLTHTSGLRDPTWPWNADGDEKAPDWQRGRAPGWPQIYAMFPYTGIAFKPGSKYNYSNPGSSLMGHIVELATGDDIEVYIDKNILRPLGMTKTYFDITPYHLQQFRSASYLWRDGKRTDLGREFDTGATNGNGGLNAPISDLVRYLEFLQGIGDTALYERILSRKTLEAMWKPAFPADYDPTVNEQMAQTFFVIDAKGADGKSRRYIGHTGSQEGYRAFFYFLPGTRAAAIMVVNTTVSPGARPFVFNTRRALFENVFPLFERRAR